MILFVLYTNLRFTYLLYLLKYVCLLSFRFIFGNHGFLYQVAWAVYVLMQNVNTLPFAVRAITDGIVNGDSRGTHVNDRKCFLH